MYGAVTIENSDQSSYNVENSDQRSDHVMYGVATM